MTTAYSSLLARSPISLGEGYVNPEITDRDREISLICWGFTLGFGFLTVWKAVKQTLKVNRNCRLRSMYLWLVWADICGSFGFGISAWFYMQGHVKPGFPLFFCIVLSWAVQIQSQLQIIINRLSVIWVNKRRAAQLRWGVFGIILVVNIMVGSIWIPMALQRDPVFEKINNVWDRIQKVIYLLVDASLNYFFVRIVKKQLVGLGLTKYDKLANFNVRIIILSVAMDIMIIGTMSYPNPYVFMAFHPPAFLVKVNIEMSMAELILKIAKSKDSQQGTTTYELSRWTFSKNEKFSGTGGSSNGIGPSFTHGTGTDSKFSGVRNIQLDNDIDSISHQRRISNDDNESIDTLEQVVNRHKIANNNNNNNNQASGSYPNSNPQSRSSSMDGYNPSNAVITRTAEVRIDVESLGNDSIRTLGGSSTTPNHMHIQEVYGAGCFADPPPPSHVSNAGSTSTAGERGFSFGFDNENDEAPLHPGTTAAPRRGSGTVGIRTNTKNNEKGQASGDNNATTTTGGDHQRTTGRLGSLGLGHMTEISSSSSRREG